VDDLEKRRLNLGLFQSLINDISSIWDSSVRFDKIWWDRHNDVFTSQKVNPTYPALFGSALTRQLRGVRNTLRTYTTRSGSRWQGPIAADLWLPEDAVIIRPGSDRGPIIASAREGKVVKIVDPSWGHNDKWQRECEALRLAHEAGLSEHLPDLIGAGTHDGIGWIVQSLVPNDRPFVQGYETLFHLKWARFYTKELFPFFNKLYDFATYEYKSGEQILHEAERITGDCADTEMVGALVKLAEKHRCFELNVISSLIHGDLSAPHIHRSKGSWVIIDWGEARRDAIIIEQLFTYWFAPQQKAKHVSSYWDWIAGQRSFANLPTRTKSDLELCLQFGQQYLSLEPNPEKLRNRVILTVLNEIIEWRNQVTNNELGYKLPLSKKRVAESKWLRYRNRERITRLLAQ